MDGERKCSRACLFRFFLARVALLAVGMGQDPSGMIVEKGGVTFLDLGREVPVSVPTLVKRSSGFSDSL